MSQDIKCFSCGFVHKDGENTLCPITIANKKLAKRKPSERTYDKADDYDIDRQPACPHCNSEVESESLPYEDGETIELECDHCEEYFQLIAHTDIYWSVAKPDEIE